MPLRSDWSTKACPIARGLDVLGDPWVLLVLREQIPASDRWWVWTCAVGVAMGLFALWYVPYFKRTRARKAQRRAEIRAVAADQAAQPCSNDSKTVSSTETPGTSTRS